LRHGSAIHLQLIIFYFYVLFQVLSLQFELIVINGGTDEIL